LWNKIVNLVLELKFFYTEKDRLHKASNLYNEILMLRDLHGKYLPHNTQNFVNRILREYKELNCCDITK
jgi:hypothetical protein